MDVIRGQCEAINERNPAGVAIHYADNYEMVVHQGDGRAGRRPHSRGLRSLRPVFTMRKGMIVLQEFFWDHADALEAAGLSE